MKVQKKENYTLISSDKNSFQEFYTSFLTVEKELENEHIIIKINNTLGATKKDVSLFIEVSEKKKKNSTSFVIINSTINVDDFPENFNIVPTLQEAEDIIEMEAIERELGF